MWVLHIDDDEDDLEFFSTAFRHFDPVIQYRGVRSLEDALAIFNSEDCLIPDIIFLDINMPRHSGFDCYAIFKNDARFLNTRFIFLSTSIDKREIPAGVAFMEKQNSIKDYVAMLRNHLPSLTSSSFTALNVQPPTGRSVYESIIIALKPPSQSPLSNELSAIQLT